jgi:hypothetical protein
MNDTKVTEPVKLSTEELDDIKSLGGRFQNAVFNFGQLYLERVNIENLFRELAEKEKQLSADYAKIQEDERKLIDKIIEKHGEGSLDIKNGTFIPSKH